MVLIVEVLACRIVVLWTYDMFVLWGTKCTICRPVKKNPKLKKKNKKKP
jgi:hypothetical protein